MSELPQLAQHSPPAPYEPNVVLRWVYRRFFSHLQVEEHWRRGVQQAAAKGVVVYVLRSLSFLDFFCLDFLLKRYGLPLVRFVNDLGLWILEPFGKGERRLSLRRQVPEEDALERTVADGFSALLFLRRPPRIGSKARRGEELETDLICKLVEIQRTAPRPLLLLPQTFVWSKTPGSQKRGLMDLIFGPVEWPGRIRVFFQFLLNYRNAQLRSGEPFDLQEFVEDNPDLTDTEIADKVRYALLRQMERERALVLGPQKKTPGRIQDELIRSPRVWQRIEAHAQETGIPVAKVETLARKELRKLCAKQSPFVLGAASRFLSWLWTRMYDGIVIDKEGIERLRDAARSGAIVLLPSHKSHIDYLVLSYALYENSLLPPLIAAGENLSFWPLGPVLRRGGAFFIRRSFKGSDLYAALVDAYMRKLLVEGFPIEFFLEGGRSRTGKLLPPKYGLLSMVVDAALMLPARKVNFVPVSIGYERIIEQRSYVHELEGGEKQAENMGNLLKSSNVLRSKWGRLYVQFGDIIDFDQVLESALRLPDGSTRDRNELTDDERRSMIQALAHRATYSINQVTVVTPASLVATALLTHRKRGITKTDLVDRCHEFLHVLEALNARTAVQLRRPGGDVREDTVEEAISLFKDARLIVQHDTGPEPIYTIPDEHRIELEYYHNNVIHFFIPRALISAAILVGRDKSVSVQRLSERVRQLSRLFKHEFMFRADIRYEQSFDETLDAMLKAGEIRREGDRISIPFDEDMQQRLERYAGLLRSFFESYLLALRGTAALLTAPMPRKDWVRKTLALGRQMYLAGEIERRESLSKDRLQAALKTLEDYELVASAHAEQLEAGAGLEGPQSLRVLEPKLYAFLKI